MGARSGNNYLSAMRKLKADVWIGGQHVDDVTIHPAFVHGARSLASLYDLQAEAPEAMTFRTADGEYRLDSNGFVGVASSNCSARG